MRVVIQCAGRKTEGAGTLRAADGRSVRFVAQPALAPPAPGRVLARPDDPSDDGRAWRARLCAYNEQPDNPQSLLPACRLYTHDVYRELVNHFGTGNVFILSAGWGLIPSSFLTPDYDITLRSGADGWKRRRAGDAFKDFQMLPDDGDDITFLGGKDYLPLFCELTAPLKARKRVYFRSAAPPALPSGFTAIRYETRVRTNWHYECARSLVAGEPDDQVSRVLLRASGRAP